jgi:hypothetical protein
MKRTSREEKDLTAALVLLELLSLMIRATHEARKRACVGLFAPFVAMERLPFRARRRLSLRDGGSHRPATVAIGRSPVRNESRALLGSPSTRRPRSGFLPGLRLRLR